MPNLARTERPSGPGGLAFRLGPRAGWTVFGALAVPLWATWPLLAVWSQAMPMFQFLTMIFAVGAVTLMGLRQPRPARVETRRWVRIAAPVMVSVGLFLSDILYLLAIRRIPAAEANLILYLWPIMVVLLGGALGRVALGRWQVAAALTGLIGAAVVLGAVPDPAGAAGILLALGGGLCWTCLVLFRLWQGPDAGDAMVPGFWLSAGVALICHLAFETWVTPDLATLVCTIIVGIVPLALGNAVWDRGARNGDAAVLAVLAYATPLVAAVFLILAGQAEPRLGLLVGGAVIVAAGIMAARPAAARG
jgi:drug/metabolite transporter (DMT)-like permease